MPNAAPGVTLRPLASAADYAACIELQKETWGQGFAEVVPGVLLKISQKVGGVAAGAFAAEDRDAGHAGDAGRLLGFVFGLTGVRHGHLTHWSHMLAVRPEARDLGLGRRLKLYQRDLLAALGVGEMLWTYDPLEARNAHLNVNRLGVEFEEYVEDMYADESESDLARGIGTDRFIVRWELAGARAARTLAGEPPDFAPFRAAPVCNPSTGPELPEPSMPSGSPPDAPRVRIAIPSRIQELKREHPAEAAAWRAGTRRAFESCLARGYRIAAFAGGPAERLAYYGLERPH
ncbi:MAG TPA: hypothetical protein VIH93_11300 [Thermoanaerobaculia bacterium]